MVEEDRWCPDILQQIAAVNAALDKVGARSSEWSCAALHGDGQRPERREEMADELMTALGRLVR